MDSEIVIVTLEYHVMAEDSLDAIATVIDILRGHDNRTSPYNMNIRTITADTGNLEGTGK